jgi:hypothetical protein
MLQPFCCLLLLLLLLCRVDELWGRREQLLADLRNVDPAAAKGAQKSLATDLTPSTQTAITQQSNCYL